MLNYPITLTLDDETLLVEFADFPEAHSVGDTEAEALSEAGDGLRSAIEMYMEDRRRVPLPSAAAAGQHTITLTTLETVKVLLWNEMLVQRLRKADLASKMGVYQQQIDRLFDLRHSSKVDQVERAAIAMGRRLNVRLL